MCMISLEGRQKKFKILHDSHFLRLKDWGSISMKMTRYSWPVQRTLGRILCLFLVLCSTVIGNIVSAEDTKQAEHVILIVLEGIGNELIKSGSMPVLAQLAKEGAVTWSAQSISPPLTVPAMASLLTGLPVNKHRVTPDWEQYDFARSFLRPPTIFDYMDLAGGKDSAVFFMDERLYQLSRPEIYVDSQVCGTAKPDCTPKIIASYVQDYLKKVTSEKGHGFRLFAVPDLLLVHLPAAAHKGRKYGWDSDAYQNAVQDVDSAIGDILRTYQEFGALDRSMVIVTGLNSSQSINLAPNGTNNSTKQHPPNGAVPWIGWGANVKTNYPITRLVSLLDTGATVLYALGLKTHTEWESHAVDEIFQVVPERRTTENELSTFTY